MVDAGWKSQNYNMKIRVSEQAVQKLRAGGSFQANVSSAKKNGLNTEGREAMNRFYGKARVSSALGNSLGKTSVGKAKPPTAQHSATGNTKPKSNPTTAPTKAAPKARPNSFASGTGNFIKNELLGVDDFSKLRGEMKQHRWGAMAKSILAGSLELGTTAAAVAAAIPTGGVSLAADIGRVGAKQAGKQIGKAAVKKVSTTVSKDALKAGARKAATTAATGSLRKGAVNTVKAVVKAPAAPFRAPGKAVRAAQGVLDASNPVLKRAATTAAKADKARKDMASAKKAHEALMASGKGKAVKGLPKAYDARKAATVAARKATSESVRAGKRAAAITSKRAASAARQKAIRKGAVRVQGAHAAIAPMTRKGK